MELMLPYTPNAWFWKIGEDEDRVFSSRTMTFVPVTESVYVAWLDAGGQTSPCPDGAKLYDLLVIFALPVTMGDGIELRCTSTPALNGVYKLDHQSQAYITSIAASIASGRGVPGSGETFFYNSIEFTADQFLDVAKALEDYLYHYNVGLKTYLLSDGASGGIPETPITIA